MPITDESTLIEAKASAQRGTFLKISKASEAAGLFSDLMTSTGSPGAVATPATGLNGAALTNSLAGSMLYTNASGYQNHLLGFQAVCTVAGCAVLYDRLWHNSGYVVTTTTAQNTTHPGLPSRDANGATAGAGVELWIEVYTATTNVGAITNMTASYTNQNGTAGRTATLASFPATAVAGTMCQFSLQSGDTGVQSVQSLTLGTSLLTGAVGLVQLRQLATQVISLANVFAASDIGLEKLYDGSCLGLAWLNTSTATGNLYGSVLVGGTATTASGGGGGGGSTPTPVEFPVYGEPTLSFTVDAAQVTEVRETKKGVAIDTPSGTVVTSETYANVLTALGW